MRWEINMCRVCSLFEDYLLKPFNDLDDFVMLLFFQEDCCHASHVPRGGKADAHNLAKYINLDLATDSGLEGYAVSCPKKREGKGAGARGSAGKGKKRSQPHNTFAKLIN